MAHPSASVRGLQAHVSAFAGAVRQQDGQRLAKLMRVSEGSHREVVAAGLHTIQDASELVSRVPDGLGDVVGAILQSMAAAHAGRNVEAYNHLQQAANLFLPIFRGWEGIWPLPAMHSLAYDLRIAAEKADAELAAAGKPADRLKGAGSFLMKVFGALAGKGDKRRGALYVACQLFKVYFKLGTLHMSKSIIRVIDASRGFEEFPMRDQVTYRYYTGRLDVFNDSFSEADSRLSFALERCPTSKPQNMRKLLKYLIPVRLCRGILPAHSLLQQFQLTEYTGIVQAMRSGDVRLLRDTLETYEDRFLKAGVYLVLEKLELHVFRRLIRKIYLLLREKDAQRAHQIRMALLLHALKWMGMDMDGDEMACIIATLIHKGYLRGYFSHKSRVLVLSKQQAFPNLTGRVL